DPGFLRRLTCPRPREMGKVSGGWRESAREAATWLEEYDALALYELARNGWQHKRDDDEKQVDLIERWEQGEASAPISFIELHDEILNLILPRIAPRRLFDQSGNLYVEPPVRDWREILSSWHTFVTARVQWPRLVRYVGQI